MVSVFSVCYYSYSSEMVVRKGDVWMSDPIDLSKARKAREDKERKAKAEAERRQAIADANKPATVEEKNRIHMKVEEGIKRLAETVKSMKDEVLRRSKLRLDPHTGEVKDDNHKEDRDR